MVKKIALLTKDKWLWTICRSDRLAVMSRADIHWVNESWTHSAPDLIQSWTALKSYYKESVNGSLVNDSKRIFSHCDEWKCHHYTWCDYLCYHELMFIPFFRSQSSSFTCLLFYWNPFEDSASWWSLLTDKTNKQNDWYSFFFQFSK